jgi:cysteine-rich repeat protein
VSRSLGLCGPACLLLACRAQGIDDEQPTPEPLRTQAAVPREVARVERQVERPPPVPDGLRCGDGVVARAEECDDANTDEHDACLANCKLASCGDGLRFIGAERCDDGNLVDGDGCSAACVAEYKRVFVSSQTYDGNLGGLDGADQKCQTLADAAGLGGTYRAWIATVHGSPSTRFVRSKAPYVLVDGTLVARSWADLVRRGPEVPIAMTERGGPGPLSNACVSDDIIVVWSGVDGQGKLLAKVCDDFTMPAGPGHFGIAAADLSWTAACAGFDCSARAALYCFEQ